MPHITFTHPKTKISRLVDLSDEEYRAYRLTVQELKNLWDRYDGCNAPGGFDGEAIHMALNLHGEGGYCAV